MPVNMAADVHANRQACDMGRISFDVHRKSRSASPKTTGAYITLIDLF